MAAEAIKTYAFQPSYKILGQEIPSWTTPIFWMIVVAFLVPASSILGHFSGLIIGYACSSLPLFPFPFRIATNSKYIDACRYLRLLEPSEWILTKVESKLGFIFRRIPYYISLENRTEMNYWEFLPTTNSIRAARGGVPSTGPADVAMGSPFATAGPGRTLGS